jgi:hypothetical protein
VHQDTTKFGLATSYQANSQSVHDMCGRECRLLNILKIIWGSDSVLKLPHRLTDNLREAKPCHVERVHVIILAVSLFFGHYLNFQIPLRKISGVDVFIRSRCEKPISFAFICAASPS